MTTFDEKLDDAADLDSVGASTGANGPGRAASTPPRPPVSLASRSGIPTIIRAPLLVVGAIAAGEAIALALGEHELVPAPVVLDAVIQGLVASLFAAGLLLVYKAGRMISFAHGAISVATSVTLFTFVGEDWPFVLAAAVSIAGAAAAGMFIEFFILRRFASSPRLVPTVATIAAGQLLVAAVFLLPLWRFDVDLITGEATQEDIARLPGGQVHTPLHGMKWDWFPVIFTGDHLVAAVASLLAVIAVAIFLKRSLAGTAIRGAAENGERVALLGVGTAALGTLVWAIAGGLAGLGAVLSEPLRNGTLSTVGTGLGLGFVIRGLAAAVLGRMDDLPTTVAAAIGITIFDRSVFWATGRTAVGDLALLLLIAGALLVQRRALSRTDESATSTWAAADEIRPVPALLGRLPAVQSARRWVMVVIAVVVVGYPFAMSPSQVYLGATYAIYGIVGVSLVVLTGWGGQISLGQFAFVGVGAAVGGSLTANANVPFPIALLLGSLAGAGVAMLLGLPALRIRGLYLAVTTAAFAVAMSTFVLDKSRFGFLVPDQVGRPRLGPLKFEDERAYYFLCLAGLVGSVFVAQALRRSRTGRVLIAMRDNERAAQSFGISLVRTRLATFGVAGFLAAFAGVLLVHQQQAMRPEAYIPEMSVNMFLMAVIGGLGSVSGVLTGAIYLGSAAVFLDGPLGQFLAVGVGVLVVLLVYPTGLGGLVYAARDGYLRRLAIREKIFVRSLLGEVSDLDGERNRAPLADKPEPEQKYEIESDVRDAGASQRGKGWVYR